MLEALNFKESASSGAEGCEATNGDGHSTVSCTQSFEAVEPVGCLLCDKHFSLPEGKNDFLKHLLQQHQLVIADVKLIADFRRYIDHWRQRFKEKPLTDFCSVIQTNSGDKDTEPRELYYLLCDVLPEDKELRIQLQRQQLEAVLSQQQAEREDTTFSRKCLFCKQHFQGNRAELFNHMAFEHSFNVGQPDNLVHTDVFLDLLERKLQSLQCLYCERTYKDRHVLKEHMRKKQHRRIKPHNPSYDRFYIINYLELGKNWESIQSEDDRPPVRYDSDDSGQTEDWGDWKDSVQAQAVCLFCSVSAAHTDTLTEHMKNVHHFDLLDWKHRLHLSFYQQVKLVNYIRRQVHQQQCPFCQQQFDTRPVLEDHMAQVEVEPHIPDTAVWDQPEYFFPTYENDALLCGLDDEEDEEGASAGPDSSSGSDPLPATAQSVVIAEDLPVQDSILEQHGIQQLLS